MIEGAIRETGTPILVLKVIGKGGGEVTVEGILDTGFDGFLCLPISLAVSLGLELIDVTRTELADGTVMEDELVFAGRAEWDGAVGHRYPANSVRRRANRDSLLKRVFGPTGL
jgi:predicted aspartyl protease